MIRATLTKYIIFQKYSFADDNRLKYIVKTVDILKALESVCKVVMKLFHESTMNVNPDKVQAILHNADVKFDSVSEEILDALSIVIHGDI